MKTFLYKAPTADRSDMRLELESLNVCRNTDISKTFTMKTVKKKMSH